ncbi:DUF5993 family protein [Erwinia tracheiphila]|nr:DUF5993 family protein [Erwinia tracheiphila]UIA85821.1 DUF5993 family protein [Erwinia tracheiphila]UIA89991.1 DUF5993 family protein [Erwinia tracheiphila]UIA94345.1 DUF5993 family protein [Erwinia tracheiphila]UIA98517.1 DUF5993 family protein [Erwinia tracheiphila]
MYLPFLIGCGIVFSTLTGKRKLAYLFWFSNLIVVLAWLKYHATDALLLSF